MITRILTRADPQKLVKHPLSVEVYGDTCDEGFDESIKRRGVDEPIIVAADNKTIVSGVRRRNGAIKARIDDVPILVRTDLTEQIDIREAIIEANRQNERSVETRAREFRILKEIEAERAGKRQRATLKKGTSPVMENIPQREKGATRDKAAEAVGMSGKTAEHAAEVVDRIDEAHEAGDTETEEDLRETLNKKSVAAAHRKATEKPADNSASIVKDCLDRDVIDELRPQQDLRPSLTSLGNSLDKVRREIKELAAKVGGEWIESAHIEDLLKQAKRAIQHSAFYCECPVCRRELKADCNRCEGTGYVPERYKNHLSDAEKGWLEA